MLLQDDTAHAKFSPSKLPRIIQCPGSVKLCENIEQSSSSYANEGTYLHSVVEDHLTRGEYSVTSILHKDQAKHIEYKAAVEEILNWVFTLKCNNQDENSQEFIEGKVSLKSYTDTCACNLLEDVAGTADYIYYANGTLWVPDWKFGKGVIVEAGSDQSMGYAAGALAMIDAPITKVILVIGQPRIDSERFKYYETTPAEIIRWVRHTLSPALQATLAEQPILCPSEGACRWCAAKMTCRARHNMALKAAEQVFAVHAKLPDQVDHAELSVVLDMLPQLDKYIKDLTNYAFNCIVGGKEIPNYKVVHGRSIRRWKDEAVAKETLEQHGYDVSELSEIKFFSPTKAEKALKKEHRTEQFFVDLVEKPQGKLTLASASDKREPVKFNSAEDTFKHLVEECDED